MTKSAFKKSVGILMFSTITILLTPFLLGTPAIAATSAAASPQQIIIDNSLNAATGKGFTRSGFNTVLSETSDRAYYDKDFRSSGTSTTTQWAKWTPNITTAGGYEVYIKWSSSPSAPKKVPVTIGYNGGKDTDTREINQQNRCDSWYRLGTYMLATGTTNYVQITNAGGANTCADAVKFVKLNTLAHFEYKDSFENESAGGNPSHWIEANGINEWKVATTTVGKAYRHVKNTHDSAYSWLHVFEKDVDVTARFKISGGFDKNSAVAEIAVRYNSENSMIVAGFNANTRKWQIREKTHFTNGVMNVKEEAAPGGGFLQRGFYSWKELKSATATGFDINSWYTIRVFAQNDTVRLYAAKDKEPLKLVCEATNVTHLSPGRVALASGGIDTFFDDVSVTLNGHQGRVEDGVLDFVLQTSSNDKTEREGASVVELTPSTNDGKIAIRLNKNELWISSNHGDTYNKVTTNNNWPQGLSKYSSHLRLTENGSPTNELLAMVQMKDAANNTYYQAYSSTDDFGNILERGIIRPNAEDRPIVVNDKLSQVSSGRIFYVVTVRKSAGHGMQIWYSDDNGQNWSKSSTQINLDGNTWPAGKEYAEGKVIETSNKSLRLIYSFNDTNSLRQLISVDNGVSWKQDQSTSGLMNARSSFAVDADREVNLNNNAVKDAKNIKYYMVWAFNDSHDLIKAICPRSRLALAGSPNGTDWYYLMDLDRWISPMAFKQDNKNNYNPIVQFLDPSITVTNRYLYVTAGRSEQYATTEYATKGGPGIAAKVHNDQRLHVYRIDKSKLVPYSSWPAEF
jgi:hypothetical protein